MSNNLSSYHKILFTNFFDQWLELLETLNDFEGGYDHHLSRLIDLVIEQKESLSNL